MKTKNLIVIILLLIYIVSPIDLIPDVSPVGLIDDIIAGIIAYNKIKLIIDDLNDTKSSKNRKYIISIGLVLGSFMILFGLYKIITAIFG